MHDDEHGLVIFVCGKKFRFDSIIFIHWKLYIAEHQDRIDAEKRHLERLRAKWRAEERAELMARLKLPVLAVIRACNYVTSRISRAGSHLRPRHYASVTTGIPKREEEK